MPGSSVPAAINGLVSYLSGHALLTGIDVRDGLTAPDEQANVAIMVAWQDPNGVASANAVDTAADFQAQSEGLGTRMREKYSVHCAAMALDTSGDWTLARQAAYAVHSLAVQALALDRTLGGAIQGSANGQTGSLRNEVVDNVGVKALVLFDVIVEAYTT